MTPVNPQPPMMDADYKPGCTCPRCTYQRRAALEAALKGVEPQVELAASQAVAYGFSIYGVMPDGTLKTIDPADVFVNEPPRSFKLSE